MTKRKKWFNRHKAEFTKMFLEATGSRVADLKEFLSEDELQTVLRSVINRIQVVGGFISDNGNTLDVYIDAQLPAFCETDKGETSILVKVDFAAILAERAAAIVKDRGTEI